MGLDTDLQGGMRPFPEGDHDFKLGDCHVFSRKIILGWKCMELCHQFQIGDFHGINGSHCSHYSLQDPMSQSREEIRPGFLGIAGEMR